MQLEEIRALVTADLQSVDQTIVQRLASDIVLVNQVSQYIIGAGGKRLRPLSVVLAARACGHQGQKHVPAAAIIEFIHTATLLHDDVIDEAATRRGRKSANSRWGNKTTVLIGDFLTPQMVGGQSGFTFGRIIYSQFGTAFNWPFGAALATILAMVVIAVIAVIAAITYGFVRNCNPESSAPHAAPLANDDVPANRCLGGAHETRGIANRIRPDDRGECGDAPQLGTRTPDARWSRLGPASRRGPQPESGHRSAARTLKEEGNHVEQAVSQIWPPYPG